MYIHLIPIMATEKNDEGKCFLHILFCVSLVYKRAVDSKSKAKYIFLLVIKDCIS